MAIEIATAFVQVVPSMKGVGKAIESAFGSASETAGNTAGIKAGNGFAGGFGAKLGVITGIAQSVAGKAIEAFMGLSGEITSASDSAQKFASTLNFAGVSERQIKRLTASTQDYADKTVYDLNDIRNTTAQLAANGVPNYDRLAEAAGNLNAVAGGSADTFKSVAMVLTQTAGQGKLTTENWNQLSDAIPGASGKIQQALKEAATSASTIEGATGNLEAAFVKLGASVLDTAKPAITGGMSWIADGVTNAVPVVQAGIEGLIGWFQRLYSKLEENGAITAFKSAWDTIRDAIMGVVNMVIDWAHMIPPDGLANGIKLVADTLNWFVRHGKELAPIIIGIGTAFAAVKGYQALNSGLQALTGTMNTVTTAAKGVSNGIMLMTDLGGPVAMLKQMAGGLSLVKTAQTAWSTATKMATAVQGAFNAVIAANPIGAIAVAVAAVVAALAWFFTQTEAGRKAWAAFTSWLSETWAALVEGAKAIWNGLGEFLANLWSAISGGITSAWTSITSFLSGVWNGISTTATTIFNGIRDFIVNVFTVIGALIVAPLQAIQNGINTVFGWILSFITQQMNSTNTVWSTVWTAIYNVVSTIFGLISSCISTVVNAIRTVIVVFLSFLKGDWQGAWDAIKSFFTTTWDGIVAFLTPIINGIKTTIGNVLNAIQSVWASIWNAISGVVSTIWNAISGVVSTCIQNVRNTISTVLNAISGVWTSVWNRVSSFLGNIWHGITSAVSNGIQSVSNTVGRIKSTVLGAVSGAGRWLYDTGRQVIQGLINGIGGAFKWVKDTIGNLGKNLIGWAKGVLGIHSPSRIFRDEVGKWIPAGMAQGIDKASGLVADSIDGLTDMVPTVSLKTDASRLETPLAYSAVVGNGRIAYTVDDHTAEYATKQDIIDAIDQALTAGITLNLSDRGGEVMAGKLAKPMSYELNSLAMRGR
ncbi:tape measure protein [Bifidobacterium bifidum]|uniref:tape measure protein n=1 Tax=Bifidobacterium bifidum TaxID=1681 RepID=UPI00321961BF